MTPNDPTASGEAADPPWCPMVALRHERADHADHIDWLLARTPDGTEPLRSFRVAVEPWTIAANRPLGMQAIADHRASYLDYEGMVSDERGRVVRLRRGKARRIVQADGVECLELDWDGLEPAIVRIVTKRPSGDAVEPPLAEHPDEHPCWIEVTGMSLDQASV